MMMFAVGSKRYLVYKLSSNSHQGRRRACSGQMGDLHRCQYVSVEDKAVRDEKHRQERSGGELV